MNRLFRCLLVLCAVLALVYATTEKDIYTYGSTTTITSVAFPACYRSNVDVAWRIDFGSSYGNHYIVIDFLDLEHSYNCSYDYLAFYDGSTRYDPEIRKMCGFLSSSCHVTFAGRYGYVHFVTDGGNNFGGFKLFTSVGPWSSSACSSVSTTSTNSGSCRTIQTIATTSLSAFDFKQTFQTPSYPFSYNSDSDYSWKIDSGYILHLFSSYDDGYRVRITVEDWDLEKASGCYFDYIMFYDGPSASDTAYGPYCSYEDTCTFTSSGRFALVTFHSDSSKNSNGFRMRYERYSGYSSRVMSCSGGAFSTSRPGSIVLVIGVLIGTILSFDVAV